MCDLGLQPIDRVIRDIMTFQGDAATLALMHARDIQERGGGHFAMMPVLVVGHEDPERATSARCMLRSMMEMKPWLVRAAEPVASPVRAASPVKPLWHDMSSLWDDDSLWRDAPEVAPAKVLQTKVKPVLRAKTPVKVQRAQSPVKPVIRAKTPVKVERAQSPVKPVIRAKTPVKVERTAAPVKPVLRAKTPVKVAAAPVKPVLRATTPVKAAAKPVFRPDLRAQPPKSALKHALTDDEAKSLHTMAVLNMHSNLATLDRLTAKHTEPQHVAALKSAASALAPVRAFLRAGTPATLTVEHARLTDEHERACSKHLLQCELALRAKPAVSVHFPVDPSV